MNKFKMNEKKIIYAINLNIIKNIIGEKIRKLGKIAETCSRNKNKRP